MIKITTVLGLLWLMVPLPTQAQEILPLLCAEEPSGFSNAVLRSEGVFTLPFLRKEGVLKISSDNFSIPSLSCMKEDSPDILKVLPSGNTIFTYQI